MTQEAGSGPTIDIAQADALGLLPRWESPGWFAVPRRIVAQEDGERVVVLNGEQGRAYVRTAVDEMTARYAPEDGQPGPDLRRLGLRFREAFDDGLVAWYGGELASANGREPGPVTFYASALEKHGRARLVFRFAFAAGRGQIDGVLTDGGVGVTLSPQGHPYRLAQPEHIEKAGRWLHFEPVDEARREWLSQSLAAVDPIGRRVTYAYDLAGRPPLPVVEPHEYRTTYYYDRTRVIYPAAMMP